MAGAQIGLSLIFLTKTTVSLLPQALPLEILRRPPPHSLATLAQRLRQSQDDKGGV
jgi:hypothetical protein